jgi:hypothetical protein
MEDELASIAALYSQQTGTEYTAEPSEFADELGRQSSPQTSQEKTFP